MPVQAIICCHSANIKREPLRNPRAPARVKAIAMFVFVITSPAAGVKL